MYRVAPRVWGGEEILAPDPERNPEAQKSWVSPGPGR